VKTNRECRRAVEIRSVTRWCNLSVMHFLCVAGKSSLPPSALTKCLALSLNYPPDQKKSRAPGIPRKSLPPPFPPSHACMKNALDVRDLRRRPKFFPQLFFLCAELLQWLHLLFRCRGDWKAGDLPKFNGSH